MYGRKRWNLPQWDSRCSIWASSASRGRDWTISVRKCWRTSPCRPYPAVPLPCIICGGESRVPQAVREKVTAAILDAQKNGLDEVMFNESKKSAYGELVRKLGNVSAVTNTLVAAHMAGCGLYDPMQVLSEMTLDDCNRFLREEVDVRRMSLSVITPAE